MGAGRNGARLLWKSGDILGETVALCRFSVHSVFMSDSGPGGEYFWCLRHQRVESGADLCAAKYRLGPYTSKAEAEQALQRVSERNEEWETEDARWTGEQG